MHINIDSKNFIPEDFIILNFYGSDHCFAWNEGEFICFPYLYKSCTELLKVWKAPGKIKNFKSYNERVFILCFPTGIYKLTKNYEFGNLSKAGIEIGMEYYEVLAPSNGQLILEDKREQNKKILFPLSESINVQTLVLYCKNTDISLYKELLPFKKKDDIDMCLISYEKNLYRMFEQTVQVIFNCDYIIINIHPVKQCGKTIGIVLQTDTNNVIFMHVVNNKLTYDNIFLKTNVKKICPMINQKMNNSLMFIYSDVNNRIYYTLNLFNEESKQEIKTEETVYKSFKLYQSNFIICLSESKKIIQVLVENLTNGYIENSSEYIKLEPIMLKGIENIKKKIEKKNIELKDLNKQLEKKTEILKKINLFANKHQIQYCAKDSVIRLLNQVFLTSYFENIFPQNTTIVKMLRSEEKTIFSMKNVEDSQTTVEMPVFIQNLSSKLYITTDLITYKNDGGLWCLIKNYVRNPVPTKNSKIHLTSEKKRSVKHNITVLKEMINTNTITMEKLSRLKREIRQKIHVL